MKKLLSVLLAVVMVFSMFGVTSLAAGSTPASPRAGGSAFSVSEFFENLIQSIDDFFAELFGAGKNLPDVSEWSEEQIIDYYVSAAGKTNNTVVTKDTLVIDYIDDRAEDSYFDKLAPLYKSMIDDSVYEFYGITGDFEKLTVDDCETVSAYKKGRYIVVDIVLKNQTDSVQKEEVFENTISHGISIIENEKEIFDVMAEEGIVMDISEGDIIFDYTDAVISVRIDSDGYIRKGTWSYYIDVAVENLIFGFGGMSIPVNVDMGMVYKAKVGSIF